MLSIHNAKDVEKMRKYYRTSDMLNLLDFFPELSPVVDLTIVEDEKDFKKNSEFLKNLVYGRVDSLKGTPIINAVECSGHDFLSDLIKVKQIDSKGVLVLFNTQSMREERYEHLAGISVAVNIGQNVCIEAVGKGFDGREVSKAICCHERYNIPWFDLRKCSLENFKEYQTYQIEQNEYVTTRKNRVEFLTSVGFEKEVCERFIPKEYTPIPDSVWQNVVRDFIKTLEKKQELLLDFGFSNFAISGNTDGNKFRPWQMFDKTRYVVK